MDKAMEYIDKMATKLGVAVEHIYEVLVKQAYANGVVNTTIGGVLLIVCALSILFALILLTKAKYENVRGLYHSFKIPKNRYAAIANAGGGAVWYILISAILVSCVTGCIYTVEGIKSILNPEYYAIKEILDTIGGK
ncbi:hypothetical protein ABEX76_11995 [Bacillus velezensis]